MRQERDLTKGSNCKEFVAFALPLMFGNVFAAVL